MAKGHDVGPNPTCQSQTLEEDFKSKFLIFLKTDLFSANFCLSTSPLYGFLEMLFEVDKWIYYIFTVNQTMQGKH